MRQDNLGASFDKTEIFEEQSISDSRNIGKAIRVLDFLLQSDYDFYKRIWDESTEEEFEEFCKEFPEVRVVLGKK